MLREDSKTIDVGCHKGEVLDVILSTSPKGFHYGFEPIPDLYSKLVDKYSVNSSIRIINAALSDKKGKSTFNYVVTNPAYSGLQKRSYDHEGVLDMSISVDCFILDEVIDHHPIDLIKIDVEGGEMGVLQGGRQLINKDQPLIIFEHGLGASDHYGTTPAMIYDFFNELEYELFTLEDFLKNKGHLLSNEFEKQFYHKINYYFVAQHKTAKN